MYAVGEVVKWKSQAGGNTKEKQGTVVLVVPPREHFIDRVSYLELKAKHRTKTGSSGWGVLSRDHESYLVSVPAKNPKAKPFLYWPLVKYLYK